MVTSSLTEKVAVEQIRKGGEGASYVDVWGKHARRKNKHTGAEEGGHPVYIRIAKRPPGENGERVGRAVGCEGRDNTVRPCNDLRAIVSTLVLTLNEMGRHWRVLNRVVT